jgi:predicted Zn-dependent protease
LINRWSGTVRWNRNRISVASDTRTNNLTLWRDIRGAAGEVHATRLDDDGLAQVLRLAERSLRYSAEALEQIPERFIDEPILNPVVWSDTTYAVDGDRRTDLVQNLIDPAETGSLLSSGTLRFSADGRATMGSDGLLRYYPTTAVEASVTVRDASGTMSGWAGVTHHDFARIDLQGLAARALDKCQRSANPVAIEPGRYTVILEPQALADFFSPLINTAMLRLPAEMGMGPFADGNGNSKIGQQLLDRRITVQADPMDADGGFVPYTQDTGEPYRPVKWFVDGVLRELAYPRDYALGQLGIDKALHNPLSYRIAGGDSSVDAMIRATRRGVLVTRLHDVQIVDFQSMLLTGYTRDGLWLIENGAIAKSVRNMRFTESPLFALSNLADLGPSIRVFAPEYAVFAPAVRVHDFNFTALSDAV